MKYKEENQEKYKIVSVIKPHKCPFCKGKEVIKWGWRFNHTTKKQRWKCKSCSETFTVDDGFLNLKHKREVVTNCISLFMSGMSLRKAVEHFNQFSEYKVSHMSILRWIWRYGRMLKDYQTKFNLQISGKLHADEIFVRCKKKENYFWDIVDKDTKVLVSTYYSERRDSQSAKMLFLKVKTKPSKLITDSCTAYLKAYRKVWGARNRKIDKQIYIRTEGYEENKAIERVHNTIRQRIKVMRDFKASYSADLILSLFSVYYNFIRVHQGIRMTPIEKAGVKLDLGQNKWLGLIYNASQNKSI